MPSEERSSGRIGSRARDGVPEAALLHEDPTFPATGHAKLERPAPSLLGHAHEEAVFFPAQMQAIAFDPCSADEMHVPHRRVGSIDPRILAPERDARPLRAEK